MDRCFYQLLGYDGEYSQENILAATPSDIGELVTMHQQYYEEEYKGERNKTSEYLLPGISRSIAESSIYLLKRDDIIISFCSMIDPDIGIIFTKKAYRGQGFGRRLLEYCSSLLYRTNGVAYLMTDMHNPASNVMCQKIGYNLIYEHTNLRLA
jgi:predicted GNAT family acetyltransferase